MMAAMSMVIPAIALLGGGVYLAWRLARPFVAPYFLPQEEVDHE